MNVRWTDDDSGPESLRDLIAERIRSRAAIDSGEDAWDAIFDPTELMRGTTSKYKHMARRTYLRPRDIIKFSNLAVVGARDRILSGDSQRRKVDNKDIQRARVPYSAYLVRELDDEIKPAWPDWKRYLEMLRRIGRVDLTKAKLKEQYSALREPTVEFDEAVARFYRYSILGFQRAGGSHPRPAVPKRSVTGASSRQRCRAAWMRLRTCVRWRTRAARVATSRRNRRVSSSGIQTSGTKSAASRLCERQSVDLVRLDPGLGDGLGTQWVRDDDARAALAQDLRDGPGVHRRLEDELIVRPERAHEVAELRCARADASAGRRPLALDDRDLGEALVHVETDAAHACPLPLWGRGGQHDTYGSALEARSGQSQGRPDTPTDSWSIRTPACLSSMSPLCPCPDGPKAYRGPRLTVS